MVPTKINLCKTEKVQKLKIKIFKIKDLGEIDYTDEREKMASGYAYQVLCDY